MPEILLRFTSWKRVVDNLLHFFTAKLAHDQAGLKIHAKLFQQLEKDSVDLGSTLELKHLLSVNQLLSKNLVNTSAELDKTIVKRLHALRSEIKSKLAGYQRDLNEMTRVITASRSLACRAIENYGKAFKLTLGKSRIETGRLAL